MEYLDFEDPAGDQGLDHAVANASALHLPYRWAPRPYQMNLWRAMESGIKRAVCVWHRRAGKDLCAINWCAPAAFQRPGLYWHMFPTYAQGRKVAWEGMDRGGRPFLEAFGPTDPHAKNKLWYRKRDDDMTLWLHGGSKFQVVGCDHIDRLVGANPVGVIVSEYAIQNPAAWELVSPMLAENGGWAIFPYTPRGMNHGYELFKYAKDHPDTWFCEKLTVDNTGVVPPDVLAEEKERMPRELFEQEYYCSFEASLVGAYYAEQLSWMNEQDPPRISDRVTWIPDREVVTGWDLGHYDATAIWFAQIVAREIRVIDYYEASGKPIDHYVKVMREKPYVYGPAYVPHDATAQSLGVERTVLQQLHSLGVRAHVQPKMSLSDQHQMVRTMLRQMWIHETNCKRGLQALREYTKAPVPNERGPGGETIYRDKPLHNWASHGASALATLCAGFRPERSTEWRQPEARYVV